MYHNQAIEEKYPDPNKKAKKSYSDYKKALDDMKEAGLADREALKNQYGDIDG